MTEQSLLAGLIKAASAASKDAVTPTTPQQIVAASKDAVTPTTPQQIVAATPPVVPPAPTTSTNPPAAPVAETAFYIVQGGVSTLVAESALREAVARGYTGPVIKSGDPTWGTAATYGILPPAAPAVPPAPPSAPALAVSLLNPVSAESALPSTQIDPAELPALVDSEEAANAVFALLSQGKNSEASLAAIADSVDQGGMKHELPFAQVRKNNWFVPKGVDETATKWLPSGTRPWTGIYLSHRIGAVGWKGDGDAKNSIQPPAYSFVVPNPAVIASAREVARETLRIARAVQYTSRANRVKFDELGRLAVEIQLLFWVPEIKGGFCLLSASGYSVTDEAIGAIAALEQKNAITLPVSVSLRQKVVVNKAVMKIDPGAKNAQWPEDELKFEIDTSNDGSKLKQQFESALAGDRINFAKTLRAFTTGEDYAGLPFAEQPALLTKYVPLITR